MPRHTTAPFTVVADSNETLPYRFHNIRAPNGSLVLVRTVKCAMYLHSMRTYQVSTGNHVQAGLADYSIDGHEENIQIERKTVQDLVGSLLGGRERFEARYMRLADCKRAYLLVEGEWSDVFAHCQEHEVRHENKGVAKKISRTYDAWTMRWPSVQWCMMPGREAAETRCFRLLLTYWREFVDPSCPRY